MSCRLESFCKRAARATGRARGQRLAAGNGRQSTAPQQWPQGRAIPRATARPCPQHAAAAWRGGPTHPTQPTPPADLLEKLHGVVGVGLLPLPLIIVHRCNGIEHLVGALARVRPRLWGGAGGGDGALLLPGRQADRQAGKAGGRAGGRRPACKRQPGLNAPALSAPAWPPTARVPRPAPLPRAGCTAPCPTGLSAAPHGPSPGSGQSGW